MCVVEEWESGGRQSDVSPEMGEPGLAQRDLGKRDYAQMRPQT